MNIFLIGYRCAGKTVVGRQLALRLGFRFVDADEALVDEEGASIAEIVSARGWPVFREMEKAALRRIAAADHQVVATGGGVVLDAENTALMKSRGMLIWLRASPETVYRRMAGDHLSPGQRPALTTQGLREEIRDTMAERAPLYEAAMTRFIDTDDKTTAAVCGEALVLVAEEGKNP